MLIALDEINIADTETVQSIPTMRLLLHEIIYFGNHVLRDSLLSRTRTVLLAFLPLNSNSESIFSFLNCNLLRY